MQKISIDVVAGALKKHAVAPAQIRAIIEDLNIEAQPDAGEEKPPAVKKQYAVLLSDTDGMMPKHDFVAWVVMLPECESVATVEDRIFRSAYDFNASKKGKLMPVKTVGEAIECVPNKFFKEYEVFPKTKTPVLVLKTDNSIPKETTQ